jgi:acyl carrier protein
MNRKEVIRSALATLTKVPLASISESTRLAEDLRLRSLQRVELAVTLEDLLGIPVPDAKVMNARTVADLETTLGAGA